MVKLMIIRSLTFFCKKFSEQLPCAADDEPVCVDYLMDNASVQQYLISVEEVDIVITSHMKRRKAAGIDNLSLGHILYSHPAVV